MKRRPAAPDSGDLLNLPLSSPGTEPVGDAEVPAQDVLPLDAEPAAEPVTADHRPTDVSFVMRSSTPGAVLRARAGMLDSCAILGVVAVATGGVWLLGADLGDKVLAPLTLFAVSFSFLYHVVPLAFWGQSPGMSATGIQARDPEGAPLTLQQALARWLGALLTVVGLGLPMLLLATGRSLADRLSGTAVRLAPPTRRPAV